MIVQPGAEMKSKYMPICGAKGKCGVRFVRYRRIECAHRGTLPGLHPPLCLSRLSLGDARAAHVVPHTTPTDRVALSVALTCGLTSSTGHGNLRAGRVSTSGDREA